MIDIYFLVNYLGLIHELLQDLLVPVAVFLFFISHPWFSLLIPWHAGPLFLQVQSRQERAG